MFKWFGRWMCKRGWHDWRYHSEFKVTWVIEDKCRTCRRCKEKEVIRTVFNED